MTPASSPVATSHGIMCFMRFIGSLKVSVSELHVYDAGGSLMRPSTRLYDGCRRSVDCAARD